MKTNKWILGGLMAMAITACTSDELVENTNPTQGKKVTVTAYAPGDEANSRVSFVDDNDNTNTNKVVTLSWKDTESFSVVYHTTAQTFSKTAAGNTFTGVLPYDEENLQDSYYAVYPALSANTSLTSPNTVPFDLSTQNGTLDESLTYMYASSESGLSYQFKHLTAILKVNSFKIVEINDEGESVEINLPKTSSYVTKVEVKTQSEIKVDGSITFSNTNNEVQATITGGTQNTITINYVEQDEDGTETVKPFGNPVYIYLPPMAVENKALNFSVTVKDSNGDEKVYKAILEGNPQLPIEAGSLYNVDAVILEEDNNSYISFTNNTGNAKTFTLNKVGSTDASLQYSLNGGGWLTWSTGIVVPNQGVLRLRGANKNGEKYIGTAVDSQNYLYISITNPTNSRAASNENNGNGLPTGIICSGDIRTLINYKDYENVNTENARFCHLFSGCGSSLTDISGLQLLPNATMASFCYYRMFRGCRGLTSIPAGLLPATTLAESCYSYMFYECSGLISIPANLLPATTLEKSCYSYMFSECEGLQSVPEGLLPAGKVVDGQTVGTLAESCYSYMFSKCEGLQSVPEGLLPAISLVKDCYESMFSNCTSLTSIPAGLLPATTLAEYCYREMFEYCSELTTAPDLPATELAPSCYMSMFGYCSELVTAPALPATTLAHTCYKWMFYGCTRLTTAPALPATTLASGCYSEMFSGCTELTTAPVLPATTLVHTCYYQMFYGCEKLNSVTMLGKNAVYGTSISQCLDNWLDGVSSTGTLYKDPGLQIGTATTQIQQNSVDGIPRGWTVNVVTQPSELPGINNGGVFDDTNQPI